VSTLRVTRASFVALLAAGVGAPRASADIRDDLRILAFALTVEEVQAALYREALREVPRLDREARRVLGELRDHEVEHVDALRAAIRDAGARPAERRRVDFGDALGSRDAFFKVANTLEDAGVSGYNGAAPAFENTDFVAALASIAQVEARHAAVIRVLRGRPPAPLPLDRASNQGAVRSVYGPYTVE
jgi:rubrerythrin